MAAESNCLSHAVISGIKDAHRTITGHVCDQVHNMFSLRYGEAPRIKETKTHSTGTSGDYALDICDDACVVQFKILR